MWSPGWEGAGKDSAEEDTREVVRGRNGGGEAADRVGQRRTRRENGAGAGAVTGAEERNPGGASGGEHYARERDRREGLGQGQGKRRGSIYAIRTFLVVERA